MKKLSVLWCMCVLLPTILHSQGRESALADRHSLTAGAEFSLYNPDYYCSSNSPISCGNSHPLIKGIGVFADYSLSSRLGVEGEGRWLTLDGANGHKEATYMAGPRLTLLHYHRFRLAGKVLAGLGTITTQYYPRPGTFQGSLFVFAPGVTLDYRLSRHFSLRGDYEMQRWPSFSVTTAQGVRHNSGISPNGFSMGIAYTIRRR